MDVRVLQTLCKRAFWVGCSSPPHFFAVEYLASKEHHHWNTPASITQCGLCVTFMINVTLLQLPMEAYRNQQFSIWKSSISKIAGFGMSYSTMNLRCGKIPLSLSLCVCPFCDKFLRQLCLFGAAYSPLAYTRAFTKLLTHIHGKHPDWLWVWNNKFKTPST